MTAHSDAAGSTAEEASWGGVICWKCTDWKVSSRFAFLRLWLSSCCNGFYLIFMWPSNENTFRVLLHFFRFIFTIWKRKKKKKQRYKYIVKQGICFKDVVLTHFFAFNAQIDVSVTTNCSSVVYLKTGFYFLLLLWLDGLR